MDIACAMRCVPVKMHIARKYGIVRSGASLLLQHTGRLRMFGLDAALLFETCLINLVERLQGSACTN